MINVRKVAIVTLVFAGAAAMATDSPPSGFQLDKTSDADIVSGLHKTGSSAASRAEWRCSPSNSNCSTRSGTIYFSKQFKVNGGANISLAQFLNVTGSGTTGSSEPISQLTVDDQSNGTYRVSIEQGNYDCGFRIAKSPTWHDLEAGIGPNGVGWFKVDGQFCQRKRGTTSGTDRVAGDPYEDTYTGTNNYYFKYGAYNAAQGTTPSSVSWR